MAQGLAAQAALDAQPALLCHLPPPGVVQTQRWFDAGRHRLDFQCAKTQAVVLRQQASQLFQLLAAIAE